MTRPLPIIADTFRVTLNWVTGTRAQHAATVMHFRKSGGVASGLRDTLNSHVDSNMWSPLTNSVAVLSMDIIRLDGTTPSVTFSDLSGDGRWAGGVTGDWIPQSAFVVKTLTDVRGRRARGRSFLPFVAEGAQSGGSIDGDLVSAAQTAFEGFEAGLASDEWEWVVASYGHSKNRPSWEPFATPITAVVCELETATIRRRQTRNR